MTDERVEPRPVSFEDLLAGLEASIPRWQDPVMMAAMVMNFELKEMRRVGLLPNDKTEADVSSVMRVFQLIHSRPDRRFEGTPVCKRFVSWLIEKKKLTPVHGAEFVIKYGEMFGRRIMYDAIFVPSNFNGGRP